MVVFVTHKRLASFDLQDFTSSFINKCFILSD